METVNDDEKTWTSAYQPDQSVQFLNPFGRWVPARVRRVDIDMVAVATRQGAYEVRNPHALKRGDLELRAIGTRVVCRVLPVERVTPGGILLTEMRGRPNRAEVVSVGARVRGIEPDDHVLFDAYKVLIAVDNDGLHMESTPVAREGKLFVIESDHILGVITDPTRLR